MKVDLGSFLPKAFSKKINSYAHKMELMSLMFPINFIVYDTEIVN